MEVRVQAVEADDVGKSASYKAEAVMGREN